MSFKLITKYKLHASYISHNFQFFAMSGCKFLYLILFSQLSFLCMLPYFFSLLLYFFLFSVLLSNAKNIYSMYFLCFLKEDFYREMFLHCLLKTDRLNFFTQLDFLTKYDFQVTVLMKQLPMPFIKVSLLEDTL